MTNDAKRLSGNPYCRLGAPTYKHKFESYSGGYYADEEGGPKTTHETWLECACGAVIDSDAKQRAIIMDYPQEFQPAYGREEYYRPDCGLTWKTLAIAFAISAICWLFIVAVAAAIYWVWT